MKDRSIALMGAICGDIMGSPYEYWRARTKKYDFNPFPPRGRLFHIFPLAFDHEQILKDALEKLEIRGETNYRRVFLSSLHY